METPPPEPPPRRTTRSALVEIPARLGALSVSENRHMGRMHANIMTNLVVDVNLNHPNSLPSSFVSPAPSPDELVIQARGRRRIPVTWSPPSGDITPPARRWSDANGYGKKDNTPNQGINSPSKIVLRSTPRKRLLMNDPADFSPSPDKRRNMSPNAKKVRVEKQMPTFQGPVGVALKALSHDQLVDVIHNIINRHPSLEEEVKSNLPSPDLRPLNDRLHDLKRNIFKSLPNSRLTSKTDSPAYSRASTHVLAFKKALVEAGRNLVASQQWETVLEFVVMGWEQVAGTPLWDNPPHNTPRKQCFKFLAAQCMSALKKLGTLPVEQVDTLYTKFKNFEQDCEDIQACIKQLETMRKK
uniref:Putative tethering factor for nuclear proteasome sts1 n=1 Tax=Triatoma infestans TaxID=30076 RepID=A0A023F2H5_TRIIF